MSCTSCFQRKQLFAMSLAATALWAALPAEAAIYKCVAKDGSPLYQNFPCDIDSLGLTSQTSATANPPLTGAGQNNHKDTVARSAAPSGTGTLQAAYPAHKPAREINLNVGSSADDVRTVLGEPADVLEDELRTGRVSTWRYADGTTVQFDHKQRVVAVQR